MDILDRVHTTNAVKPERDIVHLQACGALLVAMKVCETRDLVEPSLVDLEYVSNGSCEAEDMKAMEKEILKIVINPSMAKPE